MKISTKGRYALRLMIEIGRKEEGKLTTLREVAEQQDISMKYLEQLVGHLTKAGLIVGHRGIMADIPLLVPPMISPPAIYCAPAKAGRPRWPAWNVRRPPARAVPCAIPSISGRAWITSSKAMSTA